MLRILATGCLVLGAGFLCERLIFVAQSVPISGEISAKERTWYSIRYRSGGEVFAVTRPLPAAADERERLQVGQAVPLRVPSSSPQDARVVGLDFWFFPVGLLLVGALGVFAARYRRTLPVTSSAPPAGR